MSDAPIISLDKISKRFGGAVALDAVSFTIARGELHAICGENGAGKSTLMKILSGVLTEYDGQYWLGGQLVRFQDTRDAEQAGVAIIHQELNLVEQLSAAANIFLGKEIRNRLGLLNEAAMSARTADLFAQLECHIHPGTPVGELRVGDQQLIEIAKALAQDARILIMDEPTSALTEGESKRLFRVVQRLRDRGVTILYISHKMNEVFRLADTITVLRDGKHVETTPKSATSARQITHAMVGREIEDFSGTPRSQAIEVLLSVKNLSLSGRADSHRKQLDNINFKLHRGEVLGIAGLMGAGRTKLLECLFGAAHDPCEGQIEMRGTPVRFRHPAESRAAGMAMVTEDRKRLGLFPHWNIRENISLCTLNDTACFGFISQSREVSSARHIAQKLNLRSAGLHASIGSLSGGNQQKAILGRWLLARPDVLLLDDPTRGIDVGAKADLYQLIDELCRQGMGIVVTSSELPELLKISDRILVLCEGRQTAEFNRDQATEHAIMEAATRRS